MNATSFQVPESFVWSSPKQGEPWSRSPWSTLHKLEPCWRAWFPSRLDALAGVCCGLGFGSYGAFSDGCVSSFTLALAQSSEFEQEPLQTHTPLYRYPGSLRP